MSDLVQIVYVSRSTFTTMPAELGIEPSVARILAQSRINNSRRGLVGALYFGDGCFFQCLEGRTADVERVIAHYDYAKLHYCTFFWVESAWWRLNHAR